MDFIPNDTISEGVVKIRLEAVGGDLDRIACRYPASFLNEMARQLTSAIENACSIEGLADSSVELVMMFASSTYMEHISANVTYRRLMLIDAVSAPRDFWVKWTKLAPVDGEYNEENILFELGEDVDQKIRQTEYKYLLNSGKEKYHNSMSRKKVTEWREVIKRAARRGELKKVESDFELAPETLELEERIADLLGKRIHHNTEPKKEEVPYITSEDDEFARAMAKARMVVEQTSEETDENAELDLPSEDEETIAVEEVLDESTETDEGEEEFAIVDDEPAEAVDEPVEEETAEEEVIEEEELDIFADEEKKLAESEEFDIFADIEKPAEPEEIDIFADAESSDESDLIDEWLTENRDTTELVLDDGEPEESIPESPESEDEPAEECIADLDEELIIPEEEEVIEESVGEEAEEIVDDPIEEELSEDVEPEFEIEIIEEPAESSYEPAIVEEATVEVAEPLSLEEEKIPAMVAAYAESAEVTPEENSPVREQVETIADRIADIRAELEIKIRLEYESRARAKAEEELIKLRRELQRIKSESEEVITQLVKENEKLRFEYEHLLEQTERDTIAREAEFARRRVEEEQLRAQIEMQLRQEATERERLAEAARLAIEEQRRLEAENARIAREREEEERLEAERIRKEEEERAIEAARQAELERIRKEEAAKRARVRSAMPTKGDGRYSYTTKTVRFLFRRSVDPNITTRIQEIIKATVDYYGKDNIYLKIKATVPDTQTVVLEFVNIPIEEMELLGNIIKILGNSGLGIAKAIIE